MADLDVLSRDAPDARGKAAVDSHGSASLASLAPERYHHREVTRGHPSDQCANWKLKLKHESSTQLPSDFPGHCRSHSAGLPS
eukprot:Skav201413  [mRNA]  locus=scaffold83:124624:128237:- [translate_table: standard]